MVLYKDTSVKNDASTSNEAGPQSKTPVLGIAKLMERTRIENELLSARVALREAEQAHANHRPCYKDEFTKFVQKKTTSSVCRTRLYLWSSWVQRGQRLTCELRDAEKAFAEAEKRVLDANLFTFPESLVDPATNFYQNDDEIDARYVNPNHIIQWRSKKGGMLTPPSCHTVATSYVESSVEDRVNILHTASPQDMLKKERYQRLLAPPYNKSDTCAVTPDSRG